MSDIFEETFPDYNQEDIVNNARDLWSEIAAALVTESTPYGNVQRAKQALASGLKQEIGLGEKRGLAQGRKQLADEIKKVVQDA